MKRPKKYSSSSNDGNGISEETSTTRLFVDDLAEVKSLCVDGKTKSDVIRELVRRALYSRRYRQASNDPAFREILRTMDEMTGVRLHHLEERLARRMEADFGLMLSLVGYLYLAADSGVEELKQVRLLVTSAEVSDEEFLKAWEGRFEETKRRVAAAIRKRSEKRRERIETGEDEDADGEFD